MTAYSAIALLAYLIGSVSFGLISAKIFCLPDPRTIGSRSTGATNMLRTGHRYAAVCTLMGDMLKAYLPLVGLRNILLRQWHIDYAQQNMVFMAAIFILLGHIFPLYAKFKGGKGVATAAGILLALWPWLGLAAIITWLLTLFATRYSSLAALCACIVILIASFFYRDQSAECITLIIMALLILQRHHANMRRLWQGTEPKVKL